MYSSGQVAVASIPPATQPAASVNSGSFFGPLGFFVLLLLLLLLLLLPTAVAVAVVEVVAEAAALLLAFDWLRRELAS